jgi:hypothetical protein
MAETMATEVSAMITDYDKNRTELPKNRIAESCKILDTLS